MGYFPLCLWHVAPSALSRALPGEPQTRPAAYPLATNQEAFEACVSVGKQLMEIHLSYEQEEEYPLKEMYNHDVPYQHALRVQKMKLSADKTVLVYSQGLTLEGIPAGCFEYRLGNRSALEWVIDQYQVSTDKRSEITLDPNRLEDEEYIIRLVKQVITVSLKTVALVKELQEMVVEGDWVVGDGDGNGV